MKRTRVCLFTDSNEHSPARMCINLRMRNKAITTSNSDPTWTVHRMRPRCATYVFMVITQVGLWF